MNMENQKMYMVFYKDNCGYPQRVMCTSDYHKAIAEMEWLNETDPERRMFGVTEIHT